MLEMPPTNRGQLRESWGFPQPSKNEGSINHDFEGISRFYPHNLRKLLKLKVII